MSHQPKNSLDVAVLLPGIGVFGGVRRFIEIGNEMVRRDHRFTIYSPEGTAPGWLDYHGESRRLPDARGARHQVVICNDPPLLEAFSRVDADLHCFYFALENIRGERAIARNRDWVIMANSTGTARRLRRRFGVDAERIIGGIDTALFHPAPQTAVEPGEYRILTFARASRPKKGVHIVVRAVESLAREVSRRSGRPAKLVMFDHVGPGNEQNPNDLIRCNVDHEMHLNLAQRELANLYNSCDVFVSAEKRAGWANTVAEAMASGVPVVCTRSGTIDLAIAGETAWVVRLRHQWSIRRGLRALYDNPGFADTLAKNALEHVQRYTWSAVADQLEEVLYRRLSGRGGISL